MSNHPSFCIETWCTKIYFLRKVLFQIFKAPKFWDSTVRFCRVQITALEQLETIPWLTLHSIANAQSWAEYAGLELPPGDIDVQAGGEAVHLRFVSGAALTPADAPGFVESAGDIGRWGMPFTKELGRQFSVGDDVSLLAIPRPPRSIVRAMQEGWFAVRELGFQLFLSTLW